MNGFIQCVALCNNSFTHIRQFDYKCATTHSLPPVNNVANCGSPIGEPLGTRSRKQNRYPFCPKT